MSKVQDASLLFQHITLSRDSDSAHFQVTTEGLSVPHLTCWRTEGTFTAARRCCGVFVILAPDIKLQTYLLTYSTLVLLPVTCQFPLNLVLLCLSSSSSGLCDRRQSRVFNCAVSEQAWTAVVTVQLLVVDFVLRAFLPVSYTHLKLPTKRIV